MQAILEPNMMLLEKPFEPFSDKDYLTIEQARKINYN
jgi:hypothetical protein